MQDATRTGVKWLPLLRKSGEADLGLSLVRLATLAAAAHRFEAAQSMGRVVGDGEERPEGMANGLADSTVVSGGMDAAGSAHTEVSW